MPHYIGTSGWNYRHWREAFYPASLPASRWLGFYARHFPSVEINATFTVSPAMRRSMRGESPYRRVSALR